MRIQKIRRAFGSFSLSEAFDSIERILIIEFNDKEYPIFSDFLKKQLQRPKTQQLKGQDRCYGQLFY